MASSKIQYYAFLSIGIALVIVTIVILSLNASDHSTEKIPDESSLSLDVSHQSTEKIPDEPLPLEQIWIAKLMFQPPNCFSFASTFRAPAHLDNCLDDDGENRRCTSDESKIKRDKIGYLDQEIQCDFIRVCNDKLSRTVFANDTSRDLYTYDVRNHLSQTTRFVEGPVTIDMVIRECSFAKMQEFADSDVLLESDYEPGVFKYKLESFNDALEYYRTYLPNHPLLPENVIQPFESYMDLDRDNDGLFNWIDFCPDHYGDFYFRGCGTNMQEFNALRFIRNDTVFGNTEEKPYLP